MTMETAPNIGDRVRIICAAAGALGSNGMTGVVTDEPSNSGVGVGIKVKMDDGRVWAIGKFNDLVLELIEAAKPAEKTITQSFSIFGDSNVQFKKYESLMPRNEYDHEKAETLAEAMSELVTIKKRKKYLEELLKENKSLKPYLWEDMTGRVQAIHTIDDAHFQNIIHFLALKGRAISKEIRAEAASRSIDIPENYTSDDESYDDDEGYNDSRKWDF